MFGHNFFGCIHCLNSNVKSFVTLSCYEIYFPVGQRFYPCSVLFSIILFPPLRPFLLCLDYGHWKEEVARILFSGSLRVENAKERQSFEEKHFFLVTWIVRSCAQKIYHRG